MPDPRLSLTRALFAVGCLVGCAPPDAPRSAAWVGSAGTAVSHVADAGRSGSAPATTSQPIVTRPAGSSAPPNHSSDVGGQHAVIAGNAAAGMQATPAGGAGATAAGSGGAGATHDDPGCKGSTWAVCEDFEGTALDSQLWKSIQMKGAVTLDNTRGARGSRSSIHIHVDPGSDTMVGITETKTFPSLKAGLSTRAFIYIPSTDTASLFMGDRHTRLIYAQGSSPDGEYALGIWNGGLIQNHYSKSDDSVDTKMLPPFDRWFCLEYELDSAGGNVKAYLDDVEIMALRHSGWPAANIDTLMFGADRYGSFPVAEELWFDDLAVDSKHIGCTR